jgi:hypothetical protein
MAAGMTAGFVTMRCCAEFCAKAAKKHVATTRPRKLADAATLTVMWQRLARTESSATPLGHLRQSARCHACIVGPWCVVVRQSIVRSRS